ncbi:FAD-binding and (Fe-S)-binding domain-containing protein [Rhizobium sp. GN54]|uniref:FAD-binding and (Fe-S)-binding domain-containing protein n=1 Tax=Rhizobium sp. GN54 TaxID=2898150 RepID=UPI001E60F5B1|nr:FAD-binding and (Fe-S)-binding domain-containing protein [Rhizobium sp. GN54]MCD2183757.1 FAD-binding oxidoreductase [Rhizobium sp. GN54]
MPTPTDAPRLLLESLRRRLLAAGFRGDIAIDAASRAAASTDNSVYQIMPGAIIAPRDAADVCLLLKVLDETPFGHLAITARGGGTGTNGQSLNHGIIVDFRRHMHRVLDLNLEEGWVEVEPGIVLDDLNEQIAASGLFFAPTTSTANRCTIGGMVATDASGKGSRIHGKTGDNVRGLDLALAGGRLLASADPPPAWAATMLAEVASACDSGRQPLLDHVPRLSRRFSGLDLERARPTPQTLEWWRLPIGAEGILGLVTRVRLRLVPRAKQSVLLVVGFDSFARVLDATHALLVTDPIAIEVMDEWVQGLADAAGLLDKLPSALRGDGGSRPVYAFVEFAGDDLAGVEAKADLCVAIAQGIPGYRGAHRASDAAEMAELWSVRAASVGLLGAIAGDRKPISFVEDCVVPPENLSAFVADFTAILEGHGLRYGIYGHADVGCLHTRPALDVAEPGDRSLYKQVSDAVYRAAKRHGGIFWGEHGKGIRGAYLRDFVGEEAFKAFQRVKRAFDPAGRFNPGKLVSLDVPLYGIETTPFRATRTMAEDGFRDAYACNGNALCLNYAARTPMCPSFKVSAELRHSPKGRAEALRAWRELKAGGREDHGLEADLHAALDGCLGCKSCAGACPTHVDIPEMKSRFLEDYHKRVPRRLADHAAIWLEALSPYLLRFAPLLGLLARLPFYGPVTRRLGIVDAPEPSGQRLQSAGLALLPPEHARERDVFLLLDPFSTLFDMAAIKDIADGLRALGFRPVALPLTPSGKAAHVKGDRRRFVRQARAVVDVAGREAAQGLPVVGTDPALVYMFRSEIAKLGLGALPEVLALEEFLLRHAPPAASAQPVTQATVFLHCTEKSIRPRSGRDWIEALARFGIAANVPDTGCCGMSGLFGHEARHQDWSRQLFDMSWRKPVEAEDAVYATGFSCRCQVKRLAGKRGRHPMALIAMARQASGR